MLEGKKEIVETLLGELDEIKGIRHDCISEKSNELWFGENKLRLESRHKGSPDFRALMSKALDDYERMLLEALAKHGLELRG